jgi:hypothetical protein
LPKISSSVIKTAQFQISIKILGSLQIKDALLPIMETSVQTTALWKGEAVFFPFFFPFYQLGTESSQFGA